MDRERAGMLVVRRVESLSVPEVPRELEVDLLLLDDMMN